MIDKLNIEQIGVVGTWALLFAGLILWFCLKFSDKKNDNN